MSSKKAMEQALTWLRSKAADRDSLDGINAELCLRVIDNLQKQIEKKGYAIHQLKMREERMDTFNADEKTYYRKSIDDSNRWIFSEGYTRPED